MSKCAVCGYEAVGGTQVCPRCEDEEARLGPEQLRELRKLRAEIRETEAKLARIPSHIPRHMLAKFPYIASLPRGQREAVARKMGMAELPSDEVLAMLRKEDGKSGIIFLACIVIVALLLLAYCSR